MHRLQERHRRLFHRIFEPSQLKGPVVPWLQIPEQLSHALLRHKGSTISETIEKLKAR
jgi:hypothetical protein